MIKHSHIYIYIYMYIRIYIFVKCNQKLECKPNNIKGTKERTMKMSRKLKIKH